MVVSALVGPGEGADVQSRGGGWAGQPQVLVVWLRAALPNIAKTSLITSVIKYHQQRKLLKF